MVTIAEVRDSHVSMCHDQTIFIDILYKTLSFPLSSEDYYLLLHQLSLPGM